MIFATTVLSTLLLSASTFAAPVRRQANPNDILVFKFAGVLERLETEFYTQALQKFQDADFTAAGFTNVNVPKEVFANILRDESAHTSIIEKTILALGDKPVTTCQFNFGDALKDVATMAATARVVENVGVSAYLGGANLLVDKNLLIAAGSILTVEARHQTALNIINQATSVPSAFDVALTPSQILAIAGSFISGCDLGIPALPALAVTGNTDKVLPGTKLSFSFDGLQGQDESKLSCQMMLGGNAFAVSLPLSECVVPETNGPVYLFVTNSSTPLQNSQNFQATNTILAGPTLAFIDAVPETLGQIAVSGGQANGVISSQRIISMDEANELLNSATSGEPAVEVVDGVTSTTSTEVVQPTTQTFAASGTASAVFAAITDGPAAGGAVEILGWSTTSASA